MTEQHPAVAYLLAAHERAELAALATTPVPLAGQWTVVRDKHADDGAPLSLVQGVEEDKNEYEPDSESYSYGVPVIVLAADWQTEAEANLRHVASHDPASVLLRVAEERALLADLENVAAGWYHEETKTLAESIIIGLAKAWGWKGQPKE